MRVPAISALYSRDSYRRKRINPIQVINVNLGFSKNLASLQRGTKFKFVWSISYFQN